MQEQKMMHTAIACERTILKCIPMDDRRSCSQWACRLACRRHPALLRGDGREPFELSYFGHCPVFPGLLFDRPAGSNERFERNRSVFGVCRVERSDVEHDFHRLHAGLIAGRFSPRL